MVLTPSGQPSGSASTICVPTATDRVPFGATNEKLDWWVARNQPGVYDEVHFSDTWVVYRYHVPDAVPGDYVISNPGLPYTPAPVTVAQFNVKRFGLPDPSDTAAGGEVAYFGSFAEVVRAGGSFALLSGDWDCTRFYPEDKAEWSGRGGIWGGSEPNTFAEHEQQWLWGGNYPWGIGERRVAWSDVVSKDIQWAGSLPAEITTLQRPRIALALRGEVHSEAAAFGGGLNGTHIRYARTVTVQSKKKIRFAETAHLSLKMWFRPFDWLLASGNEKLPASQRYSRSDCLAHMSYDNSPTIPEHDVFYYMHLLVGFTSQGLMTRDLDESLFESRHYHHILRFSDNVGKRRASSTQQVGFDQKTWPGQVQITAVQNEELHFRLQARMAFRAEAGHTFTSTPWLELFVGGELREASF